MPISEIAHEALHEPRSVEEKSVGPAVTPSLSPWCRSLFRKYDSAISPHLNPTGKNRNVKLPMSFQSSARLHAWIWRPWVCPSLCMSDAASKCVVAGFPISCILQTLIMDLSYCVPTGLPHRSVIDGRNAGGEPEPTCHSRAKHEGNCGRPTFDSSGPAVHPSA